jgi:hypothetical protein
MVPGFITDFAHGAALIPQWADGTPVRASFFGFKFCKNQISPPTRDQMIPIRTFRCSSCGYLESYARDEFAPE